MCIRGFRLIRTSCQSATKYSLRQHRSVSYAARPCARQLKTPGDIRDFLSKPTWSVKELLDPPKQPQNSQISKDKLHHLLRLSALPLPASEAEESQMIKDLESQLHFVQAIQDVDTTDVEPLQSIRDETREARDAATIGIDELQEVFDSEVVMGKRGRIRTRKDAWTPEDQSDGVDLLAQAPKRLGRYVVVDSAKD